jgi:hypothetical protein
MASNSPWVEAMAPDHASPILCVKPVQMQSPWVFDALLDKVANADHAEKGSGVSFQT